MPTYEYQCLDCGHKVDYFQSMSEPPRTVCPRCRGRLTRLVSSGAGLIFKGSGFYITDYKRRDEAKPSDDDGGREGEKEGAPPPEKEKADSSE